MPTLDALFDDSANGLIKLYTSELSRVEVAFGASEQRKQALDEKTESLIDGLWADPEVVTLVEHHIGISVAARSLMRSAIARGWRLKPFDAIHLATAQWLSKTSVPIDEFHTYDSLVRFEALTGFRIVEPHTIRPKML